MLTQRTSTFASAVPPSSSTLPSVLQNVTSLSASSGRGSLSSSRQCPNDRPMSCSSCRSHHNCTCAILSNSSDKPSGASMDDSFHRQGSVEMLAASLRLSHDQRPKDPPTIKGVDAAGTAHFFCLLNNSSSITMSGLVLRSTNLSELTAEYAERVTDVSFAANKLSTFPMHSLIECARLERLFLNGNCIKKLDLGVLRNCPDLERLWLHDNQLSQLDLEPLSCCPKLKSLYLDSNRINEVSVDLSPLTSCTQLRSLRMSGNVLAGHLDVTPLLALANLRVFDVDSGVKLTATGDPAVIKSPILKKRAHKIQFLRPSVSAENPLDSNVKKESSDGNQCGPKHLRRTLDLSPLDLDSLSTADITLRRSPMGMIRSRSPRILGTGEEVPGVRTTRSGPRSDDTSPHFSPTISGVRVLLVGFRRLARYAAEDCMASAGSVLMRAVDCKVPLVDPSVISESHVVLLHNPLANLVKQILLIARSVPTVVVSSEHCRSRLVDVSKENHPTVRFCADPLQPDDAAEILELGARYAVQLNEKRDIMSDKKPVICSRVTCDSAVNCKSPVSGPPAGKRSPRCAWADIIEKVKNLRKREKVLGLHAQFKKAEKLEAERAATEVIFRDLGGYATPENLSSIAQTYGLPKCAGKALFAAAVAATNSVEATTPETGVPSYGAHYSGKEDNNLKGPSLAKCTDRISCKALLAYWNKIKDLDPEARLREILHDSSLEYSDVTSERKECAVENLSGGRRCQFRGRQPRLCVRQLVSRFMEEQKGRFGAFSLVKVQESIVIGTALLALALKVGPTSCFGEVSERDLKRGRLNSCLIAAESGIYEGLVSGLSLEKIRAIKRNFATQSSSYRSSSCDGSTVGHALSEKELMNFCNNEKTLIPRAVRAILDVYCGGLEEMSLAQFAQFYSCMTELKAAYAANYFFSVMDVDMDGYLSMGDLRHFHMEKEGLLRREGLVVVGLEDIWFCFCDLARPAAGMATGISRLEFLRLDPESRKCMIQNIVFIDDGSATMDILKTMKLLRTDGAVIDHLYTS